VSLGDHRRAASAAAAALAEGEEHAAELRHPERAAAWLRERVLRHLRRAEGKPPNVGERREALQEIGAGSLAFAGLSSLGLSDRAALVAADVEGFDGHDLETILHASPAGNWRRVVAARSRYLAAAARQGDAVLSGAPGTSDPELPEGELRQRVQAIARRAMGDDVGPFAPGAAE
jgi:hypothetical protein